MHISRAPIPNPKNAAHCAGVSFLKLVMAYIISAPEIPIVIASWLFPAIILKRNVRISLKIDLEFILKN